jgi:hypothetical protein
MLTALVAAFVFGGYVWGVITLAFVIVLAFMKVETECGWSHCNVKFFNG